MKKITFFLLMICAFIAKAQDTFYASDYLIDGKLCEVHLFIASYNAVYTKILNPDKSKLMDSTSAILWNSNNKELDTALIMSVFSTALDKKLTKNVRDEINKDFYDFYHSYLMSPKLSIIGTGMTNFTSSAPKAYTGSTGGLGVTITRGINHQELLAMLTVAETRDTVMSQHKSDFGTTMLVPGVRKFSALLNFRWRDAFCKNFGFGVFANVTPMIWQTDTGISKIHPTVDSLSDIKYVIPINIEVYLSYLFINISGTQNPATVTFDLGLSYRSLGGDPMTNNEMNYFLGTTNTNYWGAFGGIDIHVNNQRVYFYLTLNPGTASGLSGLQAIGGLGLSATILSTSKNTKTPALNN